MKKWKVFVIISLGALILVNGTFLFVENVYIKSDNKIVVKEIKDEEIDSSKVVEIELKDNAKNMQANDLGQYIAYSEDEMLKVINTKDNSIFNYKRVTSGEVVYFKWVSGERNLLVIERFEEEGKIYLKPVVLNAKTKEIETLIDFNKNEIKLEINNNQNIKNVIFATGNNTYYIQLENEDGKSDLYSVNVMNELNKVKDNMFIDNITVTPSKTKPIIETETKITVLDSNSYIDIPGVEKYKLIGSDKNDKFYVGNEKDGKISEIYTSEILDNNSFIWDKISLEESLNIEDIKVDYSGKIYLIYKDKGSIKEITTGKSIKYEGDVIQSYCDGIIAIKNNKIVKILVK